MKSCLIVCCVIGGIIAIFAAIFVPRFFRLYNSGVSYVETVIPKVFLNWNPKDAMEYATVDLKASMMKGDETERLYIMFKKLGALKHLSKPEGNVFSKADTSTGSATYGNFAVKAEFENGSANIWIQLRRTGESWKIDGFRITSDSFLPPKE